MFVSSELSESFCMRHVYWPNKRKTIRQGGFFSFIFLPYFAQGFYKINFAGWEWLMVYSQQRQWRIQDFPEGVPNAEGGVPIYYFTTVEEKACTLLVIIDKYTIPISQWIWLYQALLEMSMNKKHYKYMSVQMIGQPKGQWLLLMNEENWT